MTGPEHVLTSGDPVSIRRTIYDAGAVLPLTGYTIRTCFQNGHGVAMTAPIAQSSSASGADWANGVLAIVMTAAQFSGVSRGIAYLEIEITSPAGTVRTLPLVPCDVQAGAM